MYDEETLYSKIIVPPRKYHLNSTSYELEGSNFKVIISEDAKQYHFPLIYKGLSVYHWLDIEFTYLGEDMAYDSSSCYSPFENRNVAFKKGDTFLRTEVYGCWFAATDFILEKGKQYSFEYPIIDYYEEYNKKGTYDVYITFLEETVSLPDVITVK